MRCPRCGTRELEPKEIDVGLHAQVCADCNGKWIEFASYERWLKRIESAPLEPDSDLSGLTIPEFELARMCPRCRRILIKYKVGSSVPFKVDRCSSCAGIWLDENEWEVLRSRNLHDDLHKIFTDHWQGEVSREETRSALEAIYEKKFGPDDYAKILDFKKWVDEHDKAHEIISFIRDKNPLQF